MGPLDLTHTLVPDRGCGDCYACCELAAIDDPGLKKPARVLCKHCVGGLCGIYETRPQTCRTFHCLYRRLAVLPEALRPDRSGVVFSFQREANPDSPFAHVYIGGYAMGDVSAYDQPEVQAAIQWLSDEGGLPVWLAFAETKQLVNPGPELARAIMAPKPDDDPDLKARAAAWTKRYDRWVWMYDTFGEPKA
jgi:hypothetical protein